MERGTTAAPAGQPAITPGATPDAIAWRLGNVESQLGSVHSKLDTIVGGFVTHSDHQEHKEQEKLAHDILEKKIEEVRDETKTYVKTIMEEIKAIRRRSWIQNTLSALFGAIMSFIAIYIVTDILSK